MSPGVKRTLAAIALLLLLLLPAPVSAHPEPVSTLVNRYVTLWVNADRLDVQYSLLYGELTAAETRRRMDSDGDGRLDERELTGAGRELGRQAPRLLELRIDGRPVSPRWQGRVDVNAEPAVAATPLVRELTASIPLESGRRTIDLQLGPELPRMGDTEVALELAGGWSLQASQASGISGPTDEPRFQLPHGHAPGEPRRVTFQIQSGQTPAAHPARLPALLALIAALAAALVAAVLIVRRRQRAAVR